mmetsp:Transcript_80925/g.177602  ORF Transcript_80925/g.177602 Transcript_80925/m.177602 type:complete len:117 (-) Transcript_80925:244-594(-)
MMCSATLRAEGQEHQRGDETSLGLRGLVVVVDDDEGVEEEEEEEDRDEDGEQEVEDDKENEDAAGSKAYHRQGPKSKQPSIGSSRREDGEGGAKGDDPLPGRMGREGSSEVFEGGL